MFRVTPIPEHAFLERAVLEGEIDRRLLQRRGFVPQVPDLRAGGLAGRVAGEPLLARGAEKFRFATPPVGVRIFRRQARGGSRACCIPRAIFFATCAHIFSGHVTPSFEGVYRWRSKAVAKVKRGAEVLLGTPNSRCRMG